jgi:hypothetical protein
MTSGDWPTINPYQPPGEVPLAVAECTPDDQLRKTLSAFRQQINALGGAWILFGLVLLKISSMGVSMGSQRGNWPGVIVACILGAISLAWISSGIAACWKKVAAIYVGVGNQFCLLTYLMFVDALNAMLLAVFNVFVVIQAHRVIGWARELQAAGIPLDAKP